MIAYQPRHFRSVAILAVGVLAATTPFALGQQGRGGRDLVEVQLELDPLARPAGDELTWQFNLLVFRHGDAATARRKLESRLKSRIDEIDRDCKLTDDQKRKLDVAGQGDLKHAFARFDELKAKFAAVADDPVEYQKFVAEVAKFRGTSTTLDCFGEGSLFSKIVAKTLTPQQIAMRQKALIEASNAQHLATIRWAVGSLDIWLKLGDAQHQKLERLLIARTRAPRKFGEYDYYGLMFQLSKLPETEVKLIFDEVQWEKLARQFAEAQRLEKVLRLGGYLPEEDVADAGKARRNDQISEPEHPRS
jgi:hypothetical protein